MARPPYAYPDPDRDYANGAFIPGAEGLAEAWAAEAQSFRAGLPAERCLTDQPYGTDPAERYDLFLPQGPAKGLLVFVHGGYWMAFGRSDWSHFAAGPLLRGWAVAMPGYTLAPKARIHEMSAQIARSCQSLRARLSLPMVVTGHSAGGHLAARMGCADLAVAPERVVPISPLAELEPLRATGMNDTLQLDAAEAAAESPARLALCPGTSAHVWVGAAERPAFLWQARVLSEEWDCGWTTEPGRNHFNVLDGLREAQSPLVDCLLAP